MEATLTLSSKQSEAWGYLMDDHTSEVGYGGAAFGGKSYMECAWITTMCLGYPDTGYLLGRKELTNLKRTTLLTLFKVFKDFGIKEGGYSYNQQNNTITFANGSQIFMLDLGYKPSDPLYTRLGGLELTGACIDESNEIEYEGIEILKTRLGRRNNQKYGLAIKLLETFNPDKGHVYRRYYKPWKESTLESHMKFVQALPTDNPHVTQEYIAQLRRSDKVTMERLLHGNFEYDDDPTAMIDYDAMLDLFTNTAEHSDNKYITADIARFGQDLTVIKLWRGLDNYKTIIRAKNSIPQTVDDVKQLERDERVPRSHVLIDEDGVGGGVLDYLPGAKGFVANSTPLANPTNKFKENYQNLKTQCTYLLARYVNDRTIHVEPINQEDQDKLVEELEQIKTLDGDKDGKKKVISKDKIKEVIGRSPDRCDALMMRMWFELKQPSSGGGFVKHGYR